MLGAPSFFAPRFPPPHLWPPQKPNTLSFYDVRRCRATLERLVDFDRINNGDVRFSVGAVNVSSGNFTYFDIDDPQDRCAPHHRQRIAAARFPGDRSGRRLLLGRRDRLEHAAAMGVRQPPARRHARLPGRPLELVGRIAARSDPGRRAPEGNPIRQPDPLRDRPFQECAGASPRLPAMCTTACRAVFAPTRTSRC